jgi:hypothetical protein
MTKHAKRILKNKLPGKKLYVDSGGFQIIQDYVKNHRINEMIDSYHFIMEKYASQIDYIFGLDVNKPGKMSEKELYDYNKYSIEQSIKSLTKYPELQDKQLFIWQTRNPFGYKVWNQLYEELPIKDIYKRWSFGGLVGFKRQSGAAFSPFVPAFMDLMVKRTRDNLTIEHIHFLGQSSMLAVFTAALLQHRYNIPQITLDSSELVRHTSLDQKLPLFYCNEECAKWISDISDLEFLIGKTEVDHIIKNKRMSDNAVFLKLMSIHVKSLFDYADNHIEEISDDIHKLDEDSFLKKWPLLKKGRFYKEFKTNHNIIDDWDPLVQSGDVEASQKKYLEEILPQYKSY